MADPNAPYCCGGCRMAHQLVSGLGLETFYDLRGDAKVMPGREDATTVPLVLPLVEEAAGHVAEGEVASVQLGISGIKCAACVWLVDKVFSAQPGAVRAEGAPQAGAHQSRCRNRCKYRNCLHPCASGLR